MTIGVIYEPHVQLIAATEFFGAGLDNYVGDFVCDADGGEALIEFAGRACYQSWSKPNPATATNAGYIRHLLEVGHGSVLEHATATFYLTGISRSLTHELIRSRHLSYSQQSQRFVNEAGAVMVAPPLLAQLVNSGQMSALETFADTASIVDSAYERLVEDFTEALKSNDTLTPTARRKAAREAARSVLMNATETRLVVTGNYRAWRQFIVNRGSEHADAEICRLAIEILEHLQAHSPNVFGDFEIVDTEDGRRVARTEFPTV